jgi:hypothetical protein
MEITGWNVMRVGAIAGGRLRDEPKEVARKDDCQLTLDGIIAFLAWE